MHHSHLPWSTQLLKPVTSRLGLCNAALRTRPRNIPRCIVGRIYGINRALQAGTSTCHNRGSWSGHQAAASTNRLDRLLNLDFPSMKVLKLQFGLTTCCDALRGLGDKAVNTASAACRLPTPGCDMTTYFYGGIKIYLMGLLHWNVCYLREPTTGKPEHSAGPLINRTFAAVAHCARQMRYPTKTKSQDKWGLSAPCGCHNGATGAYTSEESPVACSSQAPQNSIPSCTINMEWMFTFKSL